MDVNLERSFGVLMATMYSPTSTLPWIWAIEALASSKEVEASLLIDLIKQAPDMSGNMGENAREVVSFRILESLFTNALETAKNVSSLPDSKIGFESSECCEDVLCLILNESSGSKLKLSEVDMSKYDIEPFLTQKRSCMPKSSLQQLKDSIQGNHPLLAQLKEKSGLASSDKSEIVNPNDGLEQYNSESQAISASMDLIYLSSGKRDVHPQRKSPTNLCNDAIIGQRPVSPQRIEIVEANDNDNQQEIPFTDDEDSQDESKEESSQNASEHNNYIPSTPRGGGENADVANSNDKFNDEITCIAAKKRAFLSSQCTYGQDSLTEINLCIKCNKGGNLLVCSYDNCPLMVHENCLKFAPTFDEERNFYCPFCSYSREVSEYLDLEKKALLARKNLMAFLGKKTSDSLPQTEKTRSGKDGDEKNIANSVSNVNGDENPSNRLALYFPQDNGLKNHDDEHVVPLNTDADESSEEENDECAASDYCVSFRKQEKQYAYSSFPQRRRKKLPWTKVEEEKLKEGVERFSNVNDKNMPWKKIMEFGSDVFHKGRTTIDLKDKWRNLQKRP